MSQINPFRKKHLLQVQREFEAWMGPADAALGHYFRQHSAIGSKDRRWISETFYGMIRWMGLVDHFSPRPLTQEGRLEAFLKLRPADYENDSSIPPHIRVSFPKQFYELIVRSLGDKAWEFCLRCNEQAPTTVRANLLKTNRDDLIARWHGHYSIAPCAKSPVGILFHERANFFSLPEFKEGLFEVQDEASQLVAALVGAKPGDHVLDSAAGPEGKRLPLPLFFKAKAKSTFTMCGNRPSSKLKSACTAQASKMPNFCLAATPRKTFSRKKWTGYWWMLLAAVRERFAAIPT